MDYLHVLEYEFPVSSVLAPPVTLGYMDAFFDLSTQKGKNINQGQILHLVGYDVSFAAQDSAVNDFGFAIGGDICYAEPTAARVAAYKRQWEQFVHDRVTGPVRREAGEMYYVKYDSVVAAPGYTSLSDNGEIWGLYGQTVDGTYKGIFDEYEEAYPPRVEPTESNRQTKLWTTRTDLLGEQCLPFTAGITSGSSVRPEVPTTFALAHNSFEHTRVWAPQPYCWPVMCGLFKVTHRVISPLNVTQPGADTDTATLRVTLYINGWRNLK